ncbi:hypothetical protein G3A_06115 [Bacillus sp. 17376]|nr:hypothetical protein G3A_06115 [Bacillus sp. 17376]
MISLELPAFKESTGPFLNVKLVIGLIPGLAAMDI